MEKPNNFFDIISDQSKKVLLNCQKIAEDSRSITGTDHLLVALLITPNTKTQHILQKLLDKNTNLQMFLKIDEFNETKSNTNVTVEFKNILKIAADKKIQKQTDLINPEDLLLAILQYKKCSAYKILEKIGINIHKLHQELDENSSLNFSTNTQGPISFMQDELFTDDDPASMPENMFQMPQNPFFIQNPNKKKKVSYLEEYGINLTKLAKKSSLDKVIGRENETNRVIQILCRRTKNNPVLVGEPGVGKTAIIEGLAQKIISQKVPQKLQNKSIIMIDLASTIAGTMYRGQYEARIKKIIKEAKENPDIILFIDEIHTMVGTGSAEGSMDTANILKPALSRGEIRLIGATTFEEYRKFIEKDAALERRMQKIIVSEPNFNECKKILESTKNTLEKFHNVKFTDDAIDTAISLSQRYINEKFLPDKAIDILDEAAASIHLLRYDPNQQKINKLQKKLDNILSEKEQSIQKENFPQAAYLRSLELKTIDSIKKLRSKPIQDNKLHIIDLSEITSVVSNMTNIPATNLQKDNFKDVKNLSNKLSKYIVGQYQAIANITNTIKKTKTKLTDPQRPLGSFIFLGPTGVGKTELAKVMAKVIFGSEKKLVKIDMSEFMERHNVSRLVGAPPGYIGYENAGKLTEAVRNNPYSIILLDEIEKAHPEIYNILLQILEDGSLTDAKGRQVNFKNTIIIMTSNIGINKLNQQAAIGFESKDDKNQFENLKSQIWTDLKKTFNPEFINRLDNVIIFNPLDLRAIKEITKIQITKIINLAKKQNIKLTVSQDVINYIAKISFKPEYGAREIRRVIDKKITSPLADKIISDPKTSAIDILFSKNNIKFIIKSQ